MPRPLVLRAGFAGLVLAFLASAAFAASGDQKELVLRGFVTDGAGRPVASASVSAAGSIEFSTITNATGHYTLTIRVGTAGALVRRPATYVIEAKDGGARVPVDGGPAKLTLQLVAVDDSLGQLHVVAHSNFPALDRQLNPDLLLPGDATILAALNFSRRKSGAPVAPVADAMPAASPAAASPPAARPPTSPATGSKTPSPSPSAAKSSVPPAESSAPIAVAAPSSTPTVVPPPARKSKKRDEVTALDLLEASKRTGSVLGADRGLDSLLGTQFPSGAPMLAGGEASQRLAHSIDSLAREAKQEAKRRHSFTRDSVRAAARTSADGGKHGFPRGAASMAGAGVAAMPTSAKFAGPSRDSAAAIQRAAEQARRDSAKIAQRAQESEREAEHRLALERLGMRHDSTLAALRMRDSLRAVARAAEDARIAQHRDSVKAAKPPPPPLDPRPPVAGRVPGDAADADTCRCRIRGTIEARTDRPLASPLEVTLTVRGATSLVSHVRLDMGSPREFTFDRVPCGARVLDIALASGRHFTVVTPEELKVDCAAGRLIQPRIAIRPN